MNRRWDAARIPRAQTAHVEICIKSRRIAIFTHRFPIPGSPPQLAQERRNLVTSSSRGVLFEISSVTKQGK
jgi:hypothetical protein